MSDSDKKQQQQQQPEQSKEATRSPSPSALSTASSASPLIRSNSSTSSTSGSSSTWNEGPASAGGKVSPSLRRPGPTSIAAAQLQQQQLVGGSKKLASGNKLAHMTRGGGGGGGGGSVPTLNGSPKRSTKGFNGGGGKSTVQMANNEKANISGGGTSAKSFAHDFGKSIAYKAFRFNEFWSANKLRYMNLACLLMTLVCLVTILLFSRSSSSPALATGDSRRFNGNNKILVDQLVMSDTAADTSDESIDSLDRQPFVRSPSSSSYKRTIDDETNDSLVDGDDDRVRQVDEARRQLKRQQESEREAEETTSSSMPTSSSTPPASTQQPDDLFADLDPAFGLFKSIKSQLLGGANFTSIGKPIVRRSKHGATIIMSFGGALNETDQRNSSATGPLNLFEKLLGLGSPMRAGVMSMSPMVPMFAGPTRFDSMEADESQMDESGPSSQQSNQFATITINSSPFAHIFRPPHQEGPLVGPFSLLSAVPPPRPFIMSSGESGAPSGFLDMIMRASSDLADRMQRQAALNSTLKANNQTASTKNETAEESSPEVETFDVAKLLASRRASPLAMRSIYSAPRRPADAMIMISSSGSPDSSILSPPPPPPPPPFAFMPPMRRAAMDSSDSPMSPMLRAILGAGLMQSKPMEAQQQRRRWDEPTAEPKSGDEWEERESSSTANNGGRVSGTIRQIFRGPGVTVERVIRLPSGRAEPLGGQSSSVSSRWSSELDDTGATSAEATAVPRGLRSQSLSARADSPQPEDAPLRSLVPPISLPIGQLIGRIFNDLNRRADLMDDSSDPLDTPTSSSFLAGMPRPTGLFAPASFSGARQPRAFDQSTSDDSEMMAEPSTSSVSRHLQQHSDESDEDHRWSPKIRLGSARLRISPRAGGDTYTLPQRFTMALRPPTGSPELTSARIERVDHARASPSFTSPGSPLFGFPALKSSAQQQAPVPPQEKRPFKYHSNHEVAGSQQVARSSAPPMTQPQASIEQRSSNHLHHRSGLLGAASMPALGMGRRLDEDHLTGA